LSKRDEYSYDHYASANKHVIPGVNCSYHQVPEARQDKDAFYQDCTSD